MIQRIVGTAKARGISEEILQEIAKKEFGKDLQKLLPKKQDEFFRSLTSGQFDKFISKN